MEVSFFIVMTRKNWLDPKLTFWGQIVFAAVDRRDKNCLDMKRSVSYSNCFITPHGVMKLKSF